MSSPAPGNYYIISNASMANPDSDPLVVNYTGVSNPLNVKRLQNLHTQVVSLMLHRAVFPLKSNLYAVGHHCMERQTGLVSQSGPKSSRRNGKVLYECLCDRPTSRSAALLVH